MLNKAQDDDLVMNLVELALARPEQERQGYLEGACAGDTELFDRVWNYVQAEQRMNGFLLEPIYSLATFDHPFEPGELLDDRFRILREVAQGGMGIVYEAVDEKLNRRIALKCAKVGFHKRLPPEVRNATEISHPNVCKIFEIHTASTDQGEIDFLTMEFLEGETLAERLARGPLPEAEARTIARQLCAGLAEAHRNRVIHGDLKSSNIILTNGSDGSVRAVITDFGLARNPDQALPSLQSGASGGTPEYMAPELWKGGKATVASDVYALGVILCELASGRRPYGEDRTGPVVTWEERLARKPPAMHPKWDRILARCLDPDPLRRFRDADEVAEALAPRSRWWLWAAAVAAMLAIVTGVVTYERATAPKESVRLAMLPFTHDTDLGSIAETVLRDTSANLTKLRGGTKARYSAVALADVERGKVDTAEKAKTALRATHVLHGTLTKEKDRAVLHAFLTDTRTGVDTNWIVDYAPDQARYMPVALTGFVTGRLHLPPLALSAATNARAQSDYQAGLVLLRKDSMIDAAEASFERAVAADPDSALAYAGLAEAQWAKYRITRDSNWFTRAVESTKDAERRNPDLARVLFVRGVRNAINSRYEQAVAELQRALEVDPHYGNAARYLGRAYELSGQAEMAVAAYRQAMVSDPSDYRPYADLGDFYIQRDQYSQSMAPLRQAVELAPDEPNARYLLALAYMNLGQFQAAETELRIALSFRETVPVLDTLGTTLMYEGHEKDAIPFYTRALQIDPKHYLAWTNLGICYRRLNSPVESEHANRAGLEAAEAATQQSPRRGYPRAFVAYLHARLGHRQLAESEIAQAMTFSADGSEVRWMAVCTYEALGEREATLSVLSSASPELLADLNRWPDLAGLRSDARFIQLMSSKHVQ